jgi:hypothetical protein
VPPPRKPYPPVPDPGVPFDLDALDDLGTDLPAPEARRRWWKRAPRAVSAPTVAFREPRALLAIVPEAEQSRHIRAALLAAGLRYAVPVRITLLTGLDARDADIWGPVVREIVHARTPFTVRLVGPEVVQDRTVCLRVVGSGTRALQQDLQHALGAATFTADDPRTAWGPVLPLAGTWTEMNRVELHDLATGVRNELDLPVEFRASAVYAFEEAAEDDLPFLDFPLRG